MEAGRFESPSLRRGTGGRARLFHPVFKREFLPIEGLYSHANIKELLQLG